MPFCYWSKFKYAYKYGFIILIFEFSKFRTDNQFLVVTFFDASDNLCVDIERLADFNYLFCMFR